MEKITKSHEVRFPACKVYLNQLAEIKDVLEKISKQVEVRTDRYRLAAIEEFRTLKPQLVESIEIACEQPYIDVSLRKWDARFYSSKDTLEIRGAADEIRNILGRHERKVFTWFMSGPISGIPFGLGVIFLLEKQFIPALIFPALGLLWIIGGVYVSHKWRIVFRFINESEETSFISRKRDEVLIAFVAALLSALATYFVTKYLG